MTGPRTPIPETRTTAAPIRTDAQRREFIRYTDTRRWPLLGRFPVGDELHDDLLAQMLGCSRDTVRSIVAGLTGQARGTAADLLADRGFRSALREVTGRPGERIVAVGDSITADRLGWFELLSAAADLDDRPAAEMVNLGVSGDTTADVLERFDLLEAARPGHVLLMLGTNDARSHGRPVAYRMISAAETARNLRALIDLVVTGLGAAVTVITPPAVDQRRIDATFAGGAVGWRADDIAEVAAIAREVAPAAIDLHGITRDRADGDFLEADGVHPTPHGQRLIVTDIVARLAARSPGGDPRDPRPRR
ncbi:SGNH/GDSL hydrolase family protein [Actinoplanes sp. CA-030573]|uniref:SGNH/GDSL hydrolase family protein n=1 Tax=Actinoplanes sp. CA-030573 TaxID=3239898 RepID=UPI003D8EC682